MTKTYLLALRTRGDHVAYLYLFVGDDDPVDQKLHKFASVLEGSVGQAATHSLTEILYGAGYSGKLHALVGLRFELPFLPCQCPVPLLKVAASPLVLGQGEHLPEVGIGQPL
jgi:hypothetical protein